MKKISKNKIRWIDLEATEQSNNIKFSKGQKHLWYYFEEIVRTENFQKFIKKMREKYKLPKEGYDIYDDDFGFAGPGAAPPDKSYLGIKKNFDQFNKEIKKKCKEIGLLYDWWDVEIIQIIIWNLAMGPTSLGGPFYFTNMDSCELIENSNRKEAKAYPLIIKINPYASRNELIDFIKKNTKHIKDLQKKSIANNGIKINKVRKKKTNVKIRNDYIYNLAKKGYSLKEISRRVNKKSKEFGSNPDEGAIGKIISIERKKRT